MLKIHDSQIWAVYNHIPGGQVVATHFEKSTRKKRVGDQEMEITATPMDQLKAYERSEFVALNINGVITKNKLLIYTPENDLRGEPNAANIVLEWAATKGVLPIRSAEEKITQEVIPAQQSKRLDKLEIKIADQDEKIDKILTLLTTQAPSKKVNAESLEPTPV